MWLPVLVAVCARAGAVSLKHAAQEKLRRGGGAAPVCPFLVFRHHRSQSTWNGTPLPYSC